MLSPTSVCLLVVSTAVLTAALAPLAYRLLDAYQVLDVPNHRSSHAHPVVRGGGLACLGALALTWAGATVVGLPMPHASLLAVCLLATVGLTDDVFSLQAVARLAAQVVVGAALGAWLGGEQGVLLGAVVFPVVVNAVNFMDGINGITALTMSSWAGVTLLVAAGGADPVTLLAAITMGLGVGFLPWNVPRAHMFLGDSGSYLFGGLVSASILEVTQAATPVWALIAPLAPYLTDTGYTLLRRARARLPLLEAHHEHLYQRLQITTKLSHFAVAALVAAAAFVCGLTVWVDAIWGGGVTLLICGGYIMVVQAQERRTIVVGLE